jgi:MFS family permease
MDGAPPSPALESPLPLPARSPLIAERALDARKVVMILAVCMAMQMTAYVMITPLFARRFSELGAGVEALGLSAMAYALTGTLAAPFMGALADRFGRRPFVLGSLAVYALAFGGYLLAASPQAFILLRGLAGAFTAGLIPAVMGIVVDLAPGERRAQWIGIVNGGASIGWIAGPLLGGVLYDRWGYAASVSVSILLAAATFLAAFLTVPETHARSAGRADRDPHRKDPSTPSSILQNDLPRSSITFVYLLIVCFAVMFAYAFIEPQFMFYAYDGLGWSSSQLGLAMSAYGVALMLGEFTLGRASDRHGRKPVLVLGLALFTSQFIGLALFKDFGPIALSFILAGFGNALFDPALSAYILDITPAGHKARVMGIKSTAGSLGNVLGPALVVAFTPYVLPQGIFLIAAGLVVLLTLTSWFALKAPRSP